MIEKLEDDLKSYERSLEFNENLVRKLENILSEKFQESREIIEWYRNKGIIFTHPTINFESNGGPILGHDTKRNELIVYNPDRGFIRVNLGNKERKGTFIKNIIEDGYFETAMIGFNYLEVMLENYKSNLEEENKRLENELSKYE